MTPGDEVAGRYRLEELVGRGPMSEVWRAHDETLDRTVALKRLGPTADLERFRREARAVAALGHEHVMRVYDFGEDEAGPFMALEWLPGGTLEDKLGRGALPVAEAGAIARGIAAGLAHLHERGIVHRDLKPANVLFDGEGRPKLADFGLARGDGVGTLTEAGTVLGTAAYISPEQASGQPATPASDVYSFGVLLFRMLTGALPFIANDALALIEMHRTEPAPAVEAVNPDTPPELAALTNAALEKDPAARPADGAAVLAALGAAPLAVSAAVDTDATQVLPVAAAAAPRGRRGGVLAIALALLVLAGLGAMLAWAVARPAPATPAGNISSTVNTHHHRSTSLPTTSEQVSTTVPSTTAPTTTHARTTTAHTTTAHTTTAHTTTAQTTTTAPTTTTTPATTTAPTTTVATTTTGLTTTT